MIWILRLECSNHMYMLNLRYVPYTDIHHRPLPAIVLNTCHIIDSHADCTAIEIKLSYLVYARISHTRVITILRRGLRRGRSTPRSTAWLRDTLASHRINHISRRAAVVLID